MINNCSNQCVKSVSIRSYSGPYFPVFLSLFPYSVPMRENTDQNDDDDDDDDDDNDDELFLWYG